MITGTLFIFTNCDENSTVTEPESIMIKLSSVELSFQNSNARSLSFEDHVFYEGIDTLFLYNQELNEEYQFLLTYEELLSFEEVLPIGTYDLRYDVPSNTASEFLPLILSAEDQTLDDNNSTIEVETIIVHALIQVDTHLLASDIDIPYISYEGEEFDLFLNSEESYYYLYMKEMNETIDLTVVEDIYDEEITTQLNIESRQLYKLKLDLSNSISIANIENLTFETNEMAITIPNEALEDIEGNYYKIDEIGSQTWMAENLRTTKYNDGADIPEVTNNEEWSTLTTPGYAWYNNDSGNYADDYGALYNWYTVETDKLCPTDWHIPTHDEINTLVEFYGGSELAGGKLKKYDSNYWEDPNSGVEDFNIFSAVGAGYKSTDGSTVLIHEETLFWSSTKSESENTSGILHLSNSEEHAVLSFSNWNYGYSIRCIKD
ncbi:MAG: fibrobacter succinogenes major paralogous domain-containing protein [Reichenbachiella sp.]